MRVSAHIVVPDAVAASDWYAQAFGAEEQSRAEGADGVMTTVVAFGEDVVHVGSEVAAWGVLSALTIGGSAGGARRQTRGRGRPGAPAPRARGRGRPRPAGRPGGGGPRPGA